jgi:outer membrane protein TolC
VSRSAPILLLVVLLLPGSALGGQEAPAHRITLGDAARMAAERATPVLEAQARTDAAEARVAASTAALLPTLGADVIQGARTFNTASFGLDFPAAPGQPPLFDPRGEVVGPVKSADLRAHVDIPLVDLGSWGRRRSARASAAAVSSDERVAADRAAATAARQYIALLRARAEIGARQEDLRLAEELLTISRGLLESGVGVAIDVTRAESQLATIRAQLLIAEHRADAAELSLRHTLRLPSEATLDLADEIGSLAIEDPPDEREAVETALARRSDLETALAYEAAALESVSATRAERLPRLSASVDDGFYGRTFGRILNTYTWSVRLSIPIFDGFERSARSREEQARARELGHSIDALEEDVEFQVRRSLLDLAATNEQATAAADRERLAELEVSQEEERVRAGVAGTGDLVRAAMRLNEARTARLDALAAVHSSRVELATAMGTVRDLP